LKSYISFDFESLWGVWDTADDQYIKNNVQYSFTNLEKLLNLHKALGINFTIGMVELLLDPNPASKTNIDSVLLGREDKQLRLESLISKHKHLIKAPEDLISKLENNDKVEVISHSVFHNYFNSKAEKEILNAEKNYKKKVHNSMISKGIIFPKNQVSEGNLQYYLSEGYRIRLNFNNILYSNQYNIVIRSLRFLDSFLPICEFLNCFSKRNSHSQIIEGGIFYRPNLKFKILNTLHFLRIAFHLKYCRLMGCNFHLWSHPHNFGDSDLAFENYDKVLKYISSKTEIHHFYE